MKKQILVIAMSLFAIGSYAQFGKKLLKKGNIKAGTKLVKAATLSDDDMAALSLQSVAWMDNNNPVAPEGNAYQERLSKLVSGVKVEDLAGLNFAVYLVTDINAFATPDGSVRIMAGLMDLMTDDELLSVIGHEIGHVKLGHSKERYRTAHAISAGKDLASANVKNGQVLEDKQVGGFVENVLNAQFSQANESESDKYGFEFMVKYEFDYHAMETAFSKLAELSGDGGKGSLMSSHPGAANRSKKAKERAEKQDAGK